MASFKAPVPGGRQRKKLPRGAFLQDPGPILTTVVPFEGAGTVPVTVRPTVTTLSVVPQANVIPGVPTVNPAAAMMETSEPFFGFVGRLAKGVVSAVVPGAGTAFDVIEGIQDFVGGGGGVAAVPGGFATVPIAGKGSKTCNPGFVRNPVNGVCEFIGSPGDVSTGVAPGFGRAVMGRYGVALEPAAIPSVRLECPRGAVLGNDNLCYDHIAKANRKWIPGRKPLLTGGERNAIATASRVAGKLARTQKQLKHTARALAKVC